MSPSMSVCNFALKKSQFGELSVGLADQTATIFDCL